MGLIKISFKLRDDFERWLTTAKGYKTNGKSGRASTVSGYSYQINKLCRILYQLGRVFEEDWKKLAKEILPVMLLLQITYERKKVYTPRIEQMLFDAIGEIDNHNFYGKESVFLEQVLPHIAKSVSAQRRVKKAVFLYYEFLKRSEFGKGNIDFNEIDKKLLDTQNQLNGIIFFLRSPRTINDPISVVPEANDTEWIDDEQAAKLYGISKTTLYRKAKDKKIIAENSQSYSSLSINDYIKTCLHISEETIAAGINCDEVFDKLLSAKEAAKILYPKHDDATARRYLTKLRDAGKVSYLNLGTRTFLYFPNDIERLKSKI